VEQLDRATNIAWKWSWHISNYCPVVHLEKELHNLYSSPSMIRIIKSRRMRWAGHVGRMGEKRNAYRILVGKLERKRPLGRPRRRWVYDTKMDVVEIG
jgi:hypothetical protein